MKLFTLLILVFLVQWWRRAAVLWRRRSGIWEESLSGQVKVQWLTLCYSSLRPECWDCDGQQHGIHISQVSPENANYGRNQLQTLQITAPKTWENGDKQSHNGDTIWQNVALNATEEWNWKDKNQKYWNIAWNKYKVKKVGKSNCTASLQKGGQIGGGESGGSPEIICEESFYQNGFNLVSTHGRFQWYPILPAQNFLWLSK